MLSNKEQTFINIAAEESNKSNVLMRLGCVAVMNGKVIGRGYNSYRNRTADGFIDAHNQCTCHAEIAALRNVYRSCCSNAHGKWFDSLKVAKCSKVV
jgi:tRNA(Arg) A34 adenosine deaminase TadA